MDFLESHQGNMFLYKFSLFNFRVSRVVLLGLRVRVSASG